MEFEFQLVFLTFFMLVFLLVFQSDSSRLIWLLEWIANVKSTAFRELEQIHLTGHGMQVPVCADVSYLLDFEKLIAKLLEKW
jgi:hypothetical protein